MCMCMMKNIQYSIMLCIMKGILRVPTYIHVWSDLQSMKSSHTRHSHSTHGVTGVSKHMLYIPTTHEEYYLYITLYILDFTPNYTI